jgi:hypothetical protein
MAEKGGGGADLIVTSNNFYQAVHLHIIDDGIYWKLFAFNEGPNKSTYFTLV